MVVMSGINLVGTSETKVTINGLWIDTPTRVIFAANDTGEQEWMNEKHVRIAKALDELEKAIAAVL